MNQETGKIHTPRWKRGYVYLLAVEGSPLIKIGRSRDTMERAKRLGVALPFRTTILHTIPADNAYAAELFFHRKYASKRVKGEWFALTPTDLNYLFSIRAYRANIAHRRSPVTEERSAPTTATTKELTVTVGRKASKDFDSKEARFSVTLELAEGDSAEDLIDHWTTVLKGKVVNAFPRKQATNGTD